MSLRPEDPRPWIGGEPMPSHVAFGLNIVNVRPDCVVAFAQAAEQLGFESVWSGEHVALPKVPDWARAHPMARILGDRFNERMVGFSPDSPFLDPMVLLAHLAAATSRIRLGIGIYMLVLRDPVLVARTIASLDVLSKGRLDLAVGLGWCEEEYAYTGNDWAVRGRRTDEMLRALRVLFEDPAPEFHGEFFDFGPLGFEPKPVQKPRLPIHVGGQSRAAVRRAAELGDGWYGTTDLDHFALVREALSEADRAQDDFQYSVITLEGVLPPARIAELVDAGIERIVITPWSRTRTGEVGREGLTAVEKCARACGL